MYVGAMVSDRITSTKKEMQEVVFVYVRIENCHIWYGGTDNHR